MPKPKSLDALLKSKPKTKRGEYTLARLCEVAEELFAEKNYYSASVSEIVMRAGISVGTFYIYFNDKLSLYKYMLMQYGRRIRKRIATRLSELDVRSRYDMEREGMKAFLDFCLEEPSAFSIVWQSLFVAPDLFIDYYDDFGKQYQNRLEKAAAAGEVHPLNMEAVSYMLMGISNFLALKYITFADQDKIDDEGLYAVVDNLMFILKNGLYTKEETGD